MATEYSIIDVLIRERHENASRMGAVRAHVDVGIGQLRWLSQFISKEPSAATHTIIALIGDAIAELEKALDFKGIDNEAAELVRWLKSREGRG